MECVSVTVFALLLPILWIVARTILYPTVIAAEKVKGPFRFQLADFVWLVLQIQLVLGPVVAFIPAEFLGYRGIALTFGLISTIALWLGSVRFLSRAGIHHALRRGLFILVYLPGTLAVLVLGPLACFMAFVAVLVAPGAGIVPLSPWPRSAVLSAMLLLPPAAALGLRKLGDWLVKEMPTS